MLKNNGSTKSLPTVTSVNEPKSLQLNFKEVLRVSEKMCNSLLGLVTLLSLSASGISDAMTIYRMIDFGSENSAEFVVKKPEATKRPEVGQGN